MLFKFPHFQTVQKVCGGKWKQLLDLNSRCSTKSSALLDFLLVDEKELAGILVLRSFCREGRFFLVKKMMY